MKSREIREQEIQSNFDSFFILTDGERTPSDFKQYNRSIYNVLCKLYKNEDNKINRDYILQKFVPEDKTKEFQRTNIYNKQGILKSFKAFFEGQKVKGKSIRTVSDLTNRNESLTITIARKYGYNGNGFVNREAFVDEYKLNTLGCSFIRETPIHTKIKVEAINQEIKNIVKNIKYRSPYILQRKKPQYLKRLGQKYKDQNGKIDRLYILYKVIDDIEIVKTFRHRYATSRGLDVPSKRTTRKDINQYNLPDLGLNPEELLIEKEEQQEYLENRDKLYNMIGELPDTEQKVIQQFLADEEYNQEIFFNIITKLKNNFNL